MTVSADLPRIIRATVSWYTDRTDMAFADVQVGKIITVDTQGTYGESRRNIRIDTDPFARLAYHASVDPSIFHRYEWLEFWFAFGTLVHNQNADTFTYPRPEPIWVESHPGLKIRRPAQPVAVVWRQEKDAYQLSCASFFLGEAGQDPDQFRAQVLAQLPEPYSRRERFAMLLDRPLTVVVAAAPHQDVDDMAAQLDDPTGHIKVLRAETVEQLMATVDSADVVIIDDRLPSENEGQIVNTCGPFDLVRQCKLGERVGLIGAPMSVRREWMQGIHRGTDGYSFVLMHVEAVCSGRTIYSDQYSRRDLIDLVLDAAGLPATKPTDPTV